MIARPPILYVDDEQHNLTVFEAAFEAYYDIHTADSARQAVEILRCRDIHLVIADQRMPEMTGVQLLEVVLHEFPDIMRMILTGYIDVDAVIKAINSGRIYQYVTKPWDENELKVVIDRALETYALQLQHQALMEQLQQKAARETEIRKIFQRYVPEEVIDAALETPTIELFTGEARVVTALFCDIRGFTPLSERLEPQQVLTFLNRYFRVMSKIIIRNHGTVDRFLGDGILAVFGAPVSSLNNAENATRAALEMLAALEDFNHGEAAQLTHEAIQIGIGIHQGEVVAGNVGSDEQMEYTVVGDTVNIAERIEQLTKDKPNSIFISQAVYDSTKDQIDIEPISAPELLDKIGLTRLYRLLGPKPADSIH
ncbi:MAG: adenylate/guanylate cyclase domain-containing protein [Acidobacteriota bacterium]